eukprot:4816685-Heterocapsa_arctica.AAC.1
MGTAPGEGKEDVGSRAKKEMPEERKERRTAQKEGRSSTVPQGTGSGGRSARPASQPREGREKE